MARASVLRLALLSLIWGSSFLLIKVGLDGLAPAQVVLARVLSGAIVLGVAMAVSRLQFPRSRALWGHLAVLAVFANVVPFTLFAWGETRIDSGLAGILNGATPLLTLVFAVALLPDERISRGRVAGLLVGFVGVVVIVGPWRAGALEGELAGQVACLGAAACYGVAFTYTRRFVSGSGEPLLVLATSQLAVASAVLLVLAPLVATDAMHLSARVVAAVLTLGVAGTGIAYLLYYGLIRDEGVDGDVPDPRRRLPPRRRRAGRARTLVRLRRRGHRHRGRGAGRGEDRWRRLVGAGGRGARAAAERRARLVPLTSVTTGGRWEHRRHEPDHHPPHRAHRGAVVRRSRLPPPPLTAPRQ